MPLVDLYCPHCGGEIKLDDSREFGFCLYCGHKIMITENVKRAVRIDNSDRLANLLSLMNHAIDSANIEEMRSLSRSVLEISPDDANAWFCKGSAAAMDGYCKDAFTSWVRALELGLDPEEFDKVFKIMIVSTRGGLIRTLEEHGRITVADNMELERVLAAWVPEKMQGASFANALMYHTIPRMSQATTDGACWLLLVCDFYIVSVLSETNESATMVSGSRLIIDGYKVVAYKFGVVKDIPLRCISARNIAKLVMKLSDRGRLDDQAMNDLRAKWAELKQDYFRPTI
ncbi:MAG: zinc ribbon domain-containing protein [Candidatus Methanomethylophilaceae archaeon]|nr:zinc ribbon domain-containing protein [Candidatus Methanomethylophilaceae archaeon]